MPGAFDASKLQSNKTKRQIDAKQTLTQNESFSVLSRRIGRFDDPSMLINSSCISKFLIAKNFIQF